MPTRHRLFVLTDIENEPDDTQSLVRLLLYSNEIDIEGIVAVTSTWLRFAVHPEAIHRVLRGYAAARENLLRFDSRYPSVADLSNVVGEGTVSYGMAGVGEGYDSTGSNLLIKAVDRTDSGGRRLHVCLWGGANCLAQALYRVSNDRTSTQVAEFVDKICVYAISDQDDGGPWIRRSFPMLQYVVSVHGENAYTTATWIGFSSNPPNGPPGADPKLISKSWLKNNIQIGPLGSEYPDVAYGMEGDTPSYLACIPTGLSDPERPDWGGWGGRYTKIFDQGSRHYHDACDQVISKLDGVLHRGAAPSIWRWRDAVQYDFASRMRWTFESDLSKLQRPPRVIVDGDDETTFIHRQCKTSETLILDASETYSPHGGKLSFKWFQYKEIGSVLPVGSEIPDFDMHGTAETACLKVTLPAVTAFHINDRVEFQDGRVYHIILEVTSEGLYPLTRYRRILLEVTP